jgi:hypothetical protein
MNIVCHTAENWTTVRGVKMILDKLRVDMSLAIVTDASLLIGHREERMMCAQSQVFPLDTEDDCQDLRAISYQKIGKVM